MRESRQDSGVQQAIGSNIAQAKDGATATVKVTNITKVFKAAAPAPMDNVALTRAARLLAEMPTETVPAQVDLPPCSRMPFLRNRIFVGREPDLRALAAVLKAGGNEAARQSTALTGLGGIGKSQLAIEFAYRYGRFFAGGVFWLSCAEAGMLPGEIAACGRGLNLHPDFTGLPLDGQVALVAGAWHSELPRLLVFDNCEDEAVLETWVPRGGGCRVLVTSRRGEWRSELGVRVIPLGILARPESIELLCRHRDDSAPDDPVLDAIAVALGDLPLALHLAGAYLARYRHAPFGQPGAYLEAVRRPDLLTHRSLTVEGRSPTGHEQHVARTFALSYEQLRPEDVVDALALTVLGRAAWFAPGEPIPRDLLGASAGMATEDEAALIRFEDALSRLRELGLVAEQGDGTVALHSLLAAFVRSAGTAGEAESARASVVEAVARTVKDLPPNAFILPGPGQGGLTLHQLEPQLWAILAALQPKMANDQAWIPIRLAELLDSGGRASEAIQVLDNALACRPSEEWEVRLQAMKGRLCADMNQDQDALKVLKIAYPSLLKTLEPCHSEIVAAGIALAETLARMNQHENALGLLDTLCVNCADLKRPSSIGWNVRRATAQVLKEIRRFEEALVQLARALAIETTEAPVGYRIQEPVRPAFVDLFASRAIAGETAELQRALGRFQDPLDENTHSAIVAANHEAGRRLMEEDRFAEALTYLETAMDGCAHLYPPDALDTGATHFLLGETLLHLGRQAQAVGHLEQALSIAQANFEPGDWQIDRARQMLGAARAGHE